ncbi:MAG TPA: tetratricopeptide repeat protein, partial [Thermoanaerobaculia bacterium]|nr:tetratricopeptide repeat protein [Thermoanaerobaculia bacterium]
AALRALELDPDLAEAHASLAAVRWWHDWNRIEAEQEFRTALSLNPNYAVAHDAYGILLAEMQEMDAANEHLRRAQEIDPLSLIISTHVAFPFLFSGRVEEAIEQLQLTLDMDPDFIPALGWLGLAWERRGKFDQAIEVFERALAINDIPIVRASLAHTRASTGDTTAARADLASLIQQKERRYVSPYDIAVVHSGLREIDQAFDWLERAIDDRSAWMVFLRVDQRLDPLRGDPRFADILRRSGIESSQV